MRRNESQDIISPNGIAKSMVAIHSAKTHDESILGLAFSARNRNRQWTVNHMAPTQ